MRCESRWVGTPIRLTKWEKMAMNCYEIILSTISKCEVSDFYLSSMQTDLPRRCSQSFDRFITSIIIIVNAFIAIISIFCWCYWNQIFFNAYLQSTHTEKELADYYYARIAFTHLLNITIRQNGVGGKLRYTFPVLIIRWAFIAMPTFNTVAEFWDD